MPAHNAVSSVVADLLLNVEHDTWTQREFLALLFDPGQVPWTGGLSVLQPDGSYLPKLGTFMICNPLRDPVALYPSLATGKMSAEDFARWQSGKGIDRSAIGPIQTFGGEADSGTIEEQLTRIVASGMPRSALVFSGDARPEHCGASEPVPGKSVHVFVRLVEPLTGTDDQIEEQRIRGQVAIMECLGGQHVADLAIIDRPRKMRLGGVISRQLGPFRADAPRPRCQTILDLRSRVHNDRWHRWVDSVTLSPAMETYRDRKLGSAARSLTRATSKRPRYTLPNAPDKARKALKELTDRTRNDQSPGVRSRILTGATLTWRWVGTGALDDELALREWRAAVDAVEARLGVATGHQTIEDGRDYGLTHPDELTDAYALCEEQRKAATTELDAARHALKLAQQHEQAEIARADKLIQDALDAHLRSTTQGAK